MARFIGIILMTLMMIRPVNAEALRVVSLYPGHSDNICAMGGSELLAALSENDDDDLLPDLPRIPLRSGAERILALRPDVVVTRPFAVRINPNMYEVLERAGVKVISLEVPKWDDFPEYLMKLAESLGLNPMMGISRFADAITEISSSARESNFPRVFLEATSRELHTCAPDSWAARMITLAGGVNVAGDAVPLREGSAIAPWGVERLLMEAGNIDVYIIQTGSMNPATVHDFWLREWSSALSHARVCEIPEKYISRPSLLGLEKAGEILRQIFREASENAR